MFKRLFCKHKWEILSDTTTESKLEQFDRLGYEAEGRALFLTNKKYITIVHCSKCGKLKRFVENI